MKTKQKKNCDIVNEKEEKKDDDDTSNRNSIYIVHITLKQEF